MRCRHLVTIAALMLAACSSDKGVTDPVTNLPAGSMSAKIDGANWSASAALTASYSGNLLVFSGTNGTLTMAVAVAGATGPGTYQIGLSGIGNNALIMESLSRSWQALPQTGSGTIVVTSLSASAAAGTFTFTAPPVAGSGATGTRVVTEGRFNVKF